MKKRIECIVTGKVQMVMYRDFAKRNARGLDLTGIVQNKENRSVYIIAEGEEGNLHEFITRLHKGSFLAKVRDVQVEWSEVENQFREFKIIY